MTTMMLYQNQCHEARLISLVHQKFWSPVWRQGHRNPPWNDVWQKNVLKKWHHNKKISVVHFGSNISLAFFCGPPFQCQSKVIHIFSFGQHQLQCCGVVKFYPLLPENLSPLCTLCNCMQSLSGALVLWSKLYIGRDLFGDELDNCIFKASEHSNY